MATDSPHSSSKTDADAVAATASETPSGPPLDPTDISFAGLDENLKFNKDLIVVVPVTAAPTGKTQARKMLRAVDNQKNYLPGQPRVLLDDPPKDGKNPLLTYLAESHSTSKLDELLCYMRYIFGLPSWEHIMPLHHQGSHAREIKVTECPGLHLVWYYELIFIKPIPTYFYSPAFWEYLENADADEENKSLYKACVGFMRSYYMLIKYEIDFEEACKLRLIPKKDNGELPTYEEWCKFILPFSRVGDKRVNRRYRYGELRLTHINRTATLFKNTLSYFQVYLQWDLQRNVGSIVTILVVSSVILSAMQVVLAAVTLRQTLPDGLWPEFVDVSIWFPVVVMVSIAYLLVGLLLGGGIMVLKALFRTNVREQKEREVQGAGRLTHSIRW